MVKPQPVICCRLPQRRQDCSAKPQGPEKRAALTRRKSKDNAWHLPCSDTYRQIDCLQTKEIRMKKLVLMMATLFALSAVAVADETPSTSSAPAGATAATSTSSGTSSIVKQSAKKKKKKKKKT